jgi:arylsulfatase
MPEKLAQMRELFAMEAAKNKVYPVGGGLWVPFLHPEMRIAPHYTEWDFAGAMQRMPEFAAPALGNRPNILTIDADIPPNANGVLYKLGGAGGGLTCWVDGGRIVYEYNLFIIHRTKIRSAGKLPSGKVRIEVETVYEGAARPLGPLSITIKANGAVVAQGTVPISAPLAFSANDCLDIGKALGSPPSLDYYDRAPFPFTGTIHHVNVRYIPQPAAAEAAPSPSASAMARQ